MSVKITFVYKNLEETICEASPGESLLEVAVRNGIQMSKTTRQTCLVQIQSKVNISGTSCFQSANIAAPTDLEIEYLGDSMVNDGWRYADTYIVDESISQALVFLNIYRVLYKKRNGEVVELNPYEGELLIDVKHRRPGDIDGAYSCRGSISCSSCHCVLDITEEEFGRVKRPVCEEEVDCLGWVDGLVPTSRLGCQVIIDNSINWDKKKIMNPHCKNV